VATRPSIPIRPWSGGLVCSGSTLSPVAPALTPPLHRYPCPSQPLQPCYRTINTSPVSDPFGLTNRFRTLVSTLSTAGLDLIADADRGHPSLHACLATTLAARIHRWRSCVHHAFLIVIDGLPIQTIDDVQKAIATLHQTTCHTTRLTPIAIQEWVECDLIRLERVNITGNASSRNRSIESCSIDVIAPPNSVDF
jgi:hypothetical protein